MDCKSVGDRIKARKEALHITTNDLNERSGVPVDTINNIIYGRISNPSIEALGNIALALDTTIDYLVFGNCPNPQSEEKPHEHHKCCFDADRYVQSIKDAHTQEIAALRESHAQRVQDMKETHAREIEAIKNHSDDLRKARNFWRDLSCIQTGILVAILVWFTWDILNPGEGLIRRLQSMGIFGRNMG